MWTRSPHLLMFSRVTWWLFSSKWPGHSIFPSAHSLSNLTPSLLLSPTMRSLQERSKSTHNRVTLWFQKAGRRRVVRNVDGLLLCFGRFCRRHRLRTGENVPSIPRDLLLMSEMVLPRFIMCIIQYLRDGYVEPGEDILQNSPISGSQVWLYLINQVQIISLNYCDVSFTMCMFYWVLNTLCCTHWMPVFIQDVSMHTRTLVDENLLSCLTRQLSWARSPEGLAAAGTSDLILGGAHKDGGSNEDCDDKDLDKSTSI